MGLFESHPHLLRCGSGGRGSQAPRLRVGRHWLKVTQQGEQSWIRTLPWLATQPGVLCKEAHRDFQPGQRAAGTSGRRKQALTQGGRAWGHRTFALLGLGVSDLGTP